jgi:hypothetical protein
MKGEKPFTAATNNKAGFVQAGVTHDNFSETIALTPQQKRRILEQRAHALAQSHAQDSEQVETLQSSSLLLGRNTMLLRRVTFAKSTRHLYYADSVHAIVRPRCHQCARTYLSVIDLLDFFTFRRRGPHRTTR